jgi:RND family efflux transporter MFP subunit
MVAVASAGCGGSSVGKAELPAPWVTVAPPTQQLVTRYEYATGRVEPVEQVEIRARVSGYLDAIDFEEGREVPKGKVLYQIDPEPFKADLAKSKAALASAEADLATGEADLLRARSKLSTNKREYERIESAYKKNVASEQDRDKAKGDFDEADASVKAAEAHIKAAKAQIDLSTANVRIAELNLGYCTIRAPIAGVIGDKLVTQGNLISGGQGNTTLLTTIVAVEQMDIGFDVDENTLQRLRKEIVEGKIKPLTLGVIPVEGGLAVHGADYPLKGTINFADNRVDKKTGTIHIEARFENPRPANAPRLLYAGMYARVRIPLGEPSPAWLVPDAALGSDQGIRFLYLLGPENKAIRVDATLGNQVGDLRVIEAVQAPGEKAQRPLSAADRVIVSGIQRVRPGMVVDPKHAGK